MPLSALVLVLVAAFTHASWNFLAKRAAGARHFIWFYSVGATLIFAPVVLWILLHATHFWSASTLMLLGASAILHLLYSASLQRGYQLADLSVVYPLARGTGPLLSFIGAVALFGERPSLVACAGALAVVSGVFIIAGGNSLFAKSADRSGLVWGSIVGACIASYTLVDGYSVRILLISPFLVDYTGNLFRSLVMTPRAWRARREMQRELAHYWRHALGVALLAPVGYILILFAMQQAPISHVAPAREVSMMVGAYLGSRWLSEGDLSRRLLASALIVTGVVALALS